MNNCIWTLDGSGSLARREMVYDTSTRLDQKRHRQLPMDASEQPLFFNKKQAIESVKPTSGAAIMNDYLFGDTSSSHSRSQIGDCLSGTKTVLSSNVTDRNVPSVVYADLNIENKGIEDHFRNDSFIALSMSQAVEDPLCLNASISKQKSNEVGISENSLPEFLGNPFCREEENNLTSTIYKRSSSNMFPEPTCNNRDGNNVSLATAFNNMHKKITSVGQASMTSDSNLNQYYEGINNSMLSIGQSLNRVNYNVNTVGEKSLGPTYSKGPENLFAVNPSYNKVDEMYRSAGSAYNKGNLDFMSMFSLGGQQDAAVASIKPSCNEENSSLLSMVQNCRKGEQTTISFGGFQDDPNESDFSSRLKSYDILLNQSSAQSLVNLDLKDAVEQLNAHAVSETTSGDCNNKNKEQKTAKKVSSNNFPTNVKSLLSTGILDGVPVKYVSWAREKNLRGVVRGTGYLCGCTECKLSKAINAYEFERHAGCKTKHPNNHIYFENGKTIYAVVQELKNTPQDMLFEVIQNVAGSPINQKNFHTWKASYQAATRELQRIYGSEELIVSCCFSSPAH